VTAPQVFPEAPILFALAKSGLDEHAVMLALHLRQRVAKCGEELIIGVMTVPSIWNSMNACDLAIALT
jgi:hypothetical protein